MSKERDALWLETEALRAKQAIGHFERRIRICRSDIARQQESLAFWEETVGVLRAKLAEIEARDAGGQS